MSLTVLYYNHDIQTGDGEVAICVEGPLQPDSGPSYQWEFRLTKAPPLLVAGLIIIIIIMFLLLSIFQLKSHLVNPLLTFSTEMLRRQNELVGIIKRKDKEINDYKDGGAVISRSLYACML